MEFAGDTGGATVHGEFPAAPFILKTYKMVSDPANAAVISWGKNRNSFIVLDPFAFSRTLLPAHFKHNNFSSFVRQLNTYVRKDRIFRRKFASFIRSDGELRGFLQGFRKVDPDRWEFAHAWFLRDRTELLWRIERRRRRRDAEMDGGDEAVAVEVARLKREQTAIEERVEMLWARAREAEIRRRRMVGFLGKVFEIGEEGIEWEKRVRVRIDCEPPPMPAATGRVFAGGDGG